MVITLSLYFHIGSGISHCRGRYSHERENSRVSKLRMGGADLLPFIPHDPISQIMLGMINLKRNMNDGILCILHSSLEPYYIVMLEIFSIEIGAFFNHNTVRFPSGSSIYSFCPYLLWNFVWMDLFANCLKARFTSGIWSFDALLVEWTHSWISTIFNEGSSKCIVQQTFAWKFSWVWHNRKIFTSLTQSENCQKKF